MDEEKYTDTGIRINRSQRRWNKYGKHILIGAAIAAAIIAIIAVAANAGAARDKKVSQEATANTDADGTHVSEETQAEGSGETNAEQASESGSSAKSTALTGTPKEEEFTSSDAFEKSVFVGDVFVHGIGEYDFIDSDRVFTDSFYTAAKAGEDISSVAKTEPDKVFVMFGFDDLNSDENATAESVSDSIGDYVKDLKDELGETQVYLLSALPITEEHNDAGGDYVTQDNLNKINEALKKRASRLGVTYIDMADVFKDGDYMSSDYTGDGYHLSKGYYPFVLNGIAGIVK